MYENKRKERSVKQIAKIWDVRSYISLSIIQGKRYWSITSKEIIDPFIIINESKAMNLIRRLRLSRKVLDKGENKHIIYACKKHFNL